MVVLVAQAPITGRKPLQPRNSSSSPLDTNPKPKPKPNLDENNKENVHNYSTPAKKEKEHHFQISELLDASLAEELSAIRQKLERLRIDKDKTDEMLRGRSLLLDSQMKELVDRGVLQKQLEIEVDRLFRLKEIKLSCCKSMSPIRSLRQKEQASKIQTES
ncbi:hypothetical protein C2S53_009706 [Perilla frutescens var. hirtella]|uniref:Uncharacterized protein n=1 Tax=Perilla frutescens var. hirtella TaxID=608512 RepID=A0AAD4J157_PERFH|nr:hypothetical protein C2S53_009706 [Perilla frutescens var. hirtella]